MNRFSGTRRLDTIFNTGMPRIFDSWNSSFFSYIPLIAERKINSHLSLFVVPFAVSENLKMLFFVYVFLFSETHEKPINVFIGMFCSQ